MGLLYLLVGGIVDHRMAGVVCGWVGGVRWGRVGQMRVGVGMGALKGFGWVGSEYHGVAFEDFERKSCLVFDFCRLFSQKMVHVH